ncbi:DNA alkylation repair protein [Tahibacter amnicola]|uniref:DNA alkylation repair protein n=1 Tax=Tahibacter amnicola TaxID=2976241 RepID=A0ABY6BF69_9GAMM|nr:DNA alkylation repair protein [Tahibacter amnicola]UXI67918.1 DNA alkylation repair protein [Tahibacter amnicola]
MPATANPAAVLRRRCADMATALRVAADPARAAGMQAYMKSAMPFAGAPAPAMRRTSHALFKQWWPLDETQWRNTILALWQTAAFREQRYAAIELLSWGRAKAHRQASALPLVEQLVVEGAWWDYIDAMAPVVGDILRASPSTVTTLRRWSRHENVWLRRIAILCQLDFKHDTNVPLLFELMAPSLDSREFFLRKAIGWALRQLARTQPDVVLRYVREHESQLSPLSRREALKHLAGR